MHPYMHGEHGRLSAAPNTTAAEGAAMAARQAGWEAAREGLHADVRAAGFNFSGALSAGSVVDLASWWCNPSLTVVYPLPQAR